MGNTFVISDTWFNRPCGENYGKDSIEYNNTIINNWNNTVMSDDTVYVLGGFGICDLYDIVFQLCGNIVFMNTFFSTDEKESLERLKQDILNSVNKELVKKVTFLNKEIEILYDKDIILSYFPLADWIGKETGVYCYHGMNKRTNFNDNSVCCNASFWNLTPVDIDNVKSNILKYKSMLE